MACGDQGWKEPLTCRFLFLPGTGSCEPSTLPNTVETNCPQRLFQRINQTFASLSLFALKKRLITFSKRQLRSYTAGFLKLIPRDLSISPCPSLSLLTVTSRTKTLSAPSLDDNHSPPPVEKDTSEDSRYRRVRTSSLTVVGGISTFRRNTCSNCGSGGNCRRQHCVPLARRVLLLHPSIPQQRDYRSTIPDCAHPMRPYELPMAIGIEK